MKRRKRRSWRRSKTRGRRSVVEGGETRRQTHRSRTLAAAHVVEGSGDLRVAVQASLALGRPLLVKGEPGTGKTVLAEEVAGHLGLPLIRCHIKSTSSAQQGLYEYDSVARLRDGQLR